MNETAEDRSYSFDASQQHLYNGLARPADYSIFAREWTGPPAPSAARPACKPTLARDRHLDRQREGQGENIMPPPQLYYA